MVKTSTARKGMIRKDRARKDGVRKVAPRTPRGKGPFASIDEAIAVVRAGRMIVVVDDEDRENEGDLTMAAAKVTPEAINFMARFGRGLICLAMTPERPMSHYSPLTVEVRVSPTGQATPQPGDLRGAAREVALGQEHVVLVADELVQ